METIGSKQSYALTWCMPNNDDDVYVIWCMVWCLQHDAPVKTVNWIKGTSYSCLMTGSWDKTLKVHLLFSLDNQYIPNVLPQTLNKLQKYIC